MNLPPPTIWRGRVSGFGFRGFVILDSGSGFWVSGLVVRVSGGFGFWVLGFGFWVS